MIGLHANTHEALPLLLLPGTLCDARVFAPLTARLPGLAPIVGDMHGAISVAALAERLLETAPPRFALLGFSLGGIVSIEMAARAPERVAGLALISSNARDVPVQLHAARRAVVQDAASVATLVRETLWPSYVATARQDDAALRALIMAMAQDCSCEAATRQTEVALSRIDSRARLAGLAMPALVLAGDQDAVAPPELQRELAAGLPDAQLVLIPAVGHFAPLEAPDACADAVLAWLARVDAARHSSDPFPVEAS